MKIPNKRELQQITFNHSLDIDYKDFVNLYKKCTARPYSFLAFYEYLTGEKILSPDQNTVTD